MPLLVPHLHLVLLLQDQRPDMFAALRLLCFCICSLLLLNYAAPAASQPLPHLSHIQFS
jgi:hypothetical protein